MKNKHKLLLIPSTLAILSGGAIIATSSLISNSKTNSNIQFNGWVNTTDSVEVGNFKYTIIKKTDTDGSVIDEAAQVVGFAADYETTLATNNNVDFTIPEKIKFNDIEYVVNSIGNSAFKNKKIRITNFKLPSTIIGLGQNAFEGIQEIACDLNISGDLDIWFSCFANITEGIKGKIYLDVVTVRSSAFKYAVAKSTLTLSNRVVFIGDSAFRFNNFVGDLILPDSIKRMDESCFRQSGFTGRLKLTKHPEFTAIPRWCFQATGFTSVDTIPENITTLSTACFQNMNYWRGPILVPKTVKEIQNYALYLDRNEFIKETYIYKTTTISGTWAVYFGEESNVSVKYLNENDTLPPTISSNNFFTQNKNKIIAISFIGVGALFIFILPIAYKFLRKKA